MSLQVRLNDAVLSLCCIEIKSGAEGEISGVVDATPQYYANIATPQYYANNATPQYYANNASFPPHGAGKGAGSTFRVLAALADGTIAVLELGGGRGNGGLGGKPAIPSAGEE